MVDLEGQYWSIDVPGLTETQADALLAYAQKNFGLTGSAADPARWLTQHMDGETVQAVIRAIDMAGPEIPDQRAAEGVREIFGDWLERNRPS